MNETLEHHGILGMKWGVRRYQNKDGTWTKEGKKHRADSNDASFSKNEQKQNMKEYADTVSEYWNGVREHKSDLDLLDQVTESSPIIKAVRQTEEYGEYADSVKAYEDYMKDNFANNPDNQQKAREFVAQKYIEDPVYDEINNYQDAVNYLGESFLNDDLDAVYRYNLDTKAQNLYESMWANFDKAKTAANQVEKRYIGEMDYDNYKGKIRSGLDRPAGIALLGLPVRRLTDSDETKHSDDSSEEDSLMHYGILGMKWGIRRYQNKDGSLTAAGRKRYGDDIPDGNKSSDNSTSATPRTPAKSASEMTDQELNQALNRLRMEQQYNELTGAKSSNQYQNQQNFQSPPSNTNALSNAELQAYINRLNMEKQYKQLTTPPPKELTWGQKFVKEALPAVAMEVAKEFTKNTMKKLLGIDNGGNKDSDDGGSKKKKKQNNDNNNGNKDSLNKIYNRIDQSDKRIDSMMSTINSLNKNLKALPAPSSEKTDSQNSSVSKGFMKRMKNAANDELKREQQYNKDLRSGKYTPAGESVVNNYSTMWFYDVNRDY